jgi:putative ABC transport system permease protein
MSETVVWRARATPGVVDASALLYSGAAVQRPWGGSEAVTLIGFDLSTRLGAPWNVVAGDVGSLALPGMVVLEDSQREKLGAVNLGSVREMNGQRVRVAGFTWGLAPFAPPYAFTTLERARQIAKVGALEQDFVLVRGQNGVDPDVLAEVLQARLPETKVFSARALHQSIVRSLLAEQLGISFGTSTAFGLLIGFIIVALSMFSAVLDNLREFGTLKAIGVTNGELAILLLVQSAGYALLGSLVGLGLVAGMAEGIRSANLSVIVPWQLVAATPVVMMTLCALASALALSRIRKLEPGMVFR